MGLLHDVKSERATCKDQQAAEQLACCEARTSVLCVVALLVGPREKKTATNES